MVIKLRLRKVKGANNIVENSLYVIHDYLNYKGSFNKVFNNDNPIYIEIGCGKGKFIIENALCNPNINYIGIEKYDSILFRALEKINVDMPNLRFIKMDANIIDQVFYKEISRIYLNFSDPWPKDRHEKRRLSSNIFLGKYDLLFKDTKNIIMKTDNRKLFEYSVMSFTNYNYKIDSISLDLHSDNVYNIETEYEIKFSRKGQVIYMINVKK